MRLKNAFLIALTCVSSLSYAQDYKPFNLKGVALYINDQYDVQAIRVDSIRANNTDTIYKNYTSYVKNKTNATICKGSWIGSTILKKSNGWCYFFNYNADTIKFNLRATLNQTWKMYGFSNKSSLQASVSSVELIIFSGISDSVKTIKVTKVDSLGKNPEFHSEFKISKRNGFIKIANIFNFPDYVNSYVLAEVRIPGINVNVQTKDLFNFNVGDEFHIDKYYFQGGPYSESKLEKRKVLSKMVSSKGDTITYTDSVYTSSTTRNGLGNTNPTTYFKGIEKEVIVCNEVFLLPMAFSTTPSNIKLNELLYDTSYKKMVKLSHTMYQNTGDCLTSRFGNAPDPLIYIQGLGGPFWEAYSPSYVFSDYRHLDYYKKGSESKGTPINPKFLTSAHEIKNDPFVVLISPNPIQSLVVVEVNNNSRPEPYVFSLYDMLGHELIYKEFSDSKIEIERGSLAPGVYVFSLKSNSQPIKMGKVVLQ
jgi:hypothetical protein